MNKYRRLDARAAQVAIKTTTWKCVARFFCRCTLRQRPKSSGVNCKFRTPPCFRRSHAQHQAIDQHGSSSIWTNGSTPQEPSGFVSNMSQRTTATDAHKLKAPSFHCGSQPQPSSTRQACQHGKRVPHCPELGSWFIHESDFKSFTLRLMLSTARHQLSYTVKTARIANTASDGCHAHLNIVRWTVR